jgi:ABC-2 type transport system permease protein
MSLRRSLVICRHNLRLLRKDFFPVVVVILMPLILISFMSPTYATILRASGYQAVSGAELAIPGLSVLFGFFILAYIGYSIFREHDWNTWERLRASEARSLEIVVGKLLTPLTLLAVQQLVVFVFGVLVFGLRIRGSGLALVLVSASFVLFLVSLGILLAALCRSYQLLSALTNLSAMVLGGIGGGLTPVELMPGWVQFIAQVTPSYWAIKGFRGVILSGGGLATAAGPMAYLLSGAALCLLVASLRFRVEETKGWAG